MQALDNLQTHPGQWTLLGRYSTMKSAHASASAARRAAREHALQAVIVVAPPGRVRGSTLGGGLVYGRLLRV